MVVCSHSILMLTPYFPNLSFLRIGGFLGVEMFFVLSGFLIGYILIRQLNEHPFTLDSIIHFWTRRWFRTLPNYFLILSLNIVLFLIMGGKLGSFIAPYFVFIQNFNQPNIFFFPESWSLAVEEWFYLLFPITLFLLCILYKQEDKRKIIRSTLIIFFVFPLLFRFYEGLRMDLPSTIEVWDKFIRKIVMERLDALMFGVSMAYMKFYHQKIFSQFKNIMFILGCLVSAGSFYFFFHSQINLFFKTLYFNCISLGFALLIPYLNSIKSGPKIIVLPTTYVSVISYSMYLLYLSLILNPLEKSFSASNFYEAALLFTGYWILLLGCSALLYSFYERPMTELREKFAPARLGKSIY